MTGSTILASNAVRQAFIDIDALSVGASFGKAGVTGTVIVVDLVRAFTKRIAW